MDERELRHMLEELAEEGFPEPVGLWPRLRARIEAPSRATAVGQWIRRPLVWGLALLMLAIGIGTGAYAGGLWRAFLLAREPMGFSLATPLGLQQDRLRASAWGTGLCDRLPIRGDMSRFLMPCTCSSRSSFKRRSIHNQEGTPPASDGLLDPLSSPSRSPFVRGISFTGRAQRRPTGSP